MLALSFLYAMGFGVLKSLASWQSTTSASTRPTATDAKLAYSVVTDLTIHFCSSTDLITSSKPESGRWHRLDKDLYLYSSQQSAWLQMALAKEEDLCSDDAVVTDIIISEHSPTVGSKDSWERRPGGIWLFKSNYTASSQRAVTGVDVLFGADAVEPRPEWTLMKSQLQLNAPKQAPIARLSVRHGKADPKRNPGITLRAKDDGKFKVVQISDTHMVTGVGVCNDAIDAHGQPLPDSEADPLTVDFMGSILDVEKPDFVILTGDQLHHDILDSQSTLFKVYAPLIERSIPYAAVFGNHDSEGSHALSRTAQMAIIQDLPFSLSQSGPDAIAGVGNYYLQILGPAPSQRPVSTLFFLDSHAGIASKVQDPDYDPIKQNQIDWFTSTSRALRNEREKDRPTRHTHMSLAFQHIPLPEYANSDLLIRGGQRREPTEGPSFNSHFYDDLAEEGVVALGCGHDHVNDFCGLLPPRVGSENSSRGPWLCYAGSTGFGGYCSYGDERYHRRARIWELDSNTGGLTTWKRVEYAKQRVDELVLVEGSRLVDTYQNMGGEMSGSNAQASLRPVDATRPPVMSD